MMTPNIAEENTIGVDSRQSNLNIRLLENPVAFNRFISSRLRKSISDKGTIINIAAEIMMKIPSDMNKLEKSTPDLAAVMPASLG